MSDWVRVSRRTIVYAVVALVLWGAGVLTGLASAKIGDALDSMCNLTLLAMFGVSIGMMTWAALQCPARSWQRRGWLIVAGGFIVGFATTAWTLVAFNGAPVTFNGASPGITIALVIAGVGLYVAAASTWRAPRRLVSAAGASTLAVFLFVVMVAALTAPGPAMPFSIGPRDWLGIWRLVIDFGLLLLPVAFATLAQLRLPEAHRSRSWMWASVGALMMSMGDVVSPLVDLGHGQIYPTMMWALGIVLLTVAASLNADFELQAAAVVEPAEPTVAVA